jgi:transporter family-2 protein
MIDSVELEVVAIALPDAVGASRSGRQATCSVTSMGSTGVATSFAFVPGLGRAVQIAVQGRLGDRIGSLEALACAVVVGAAAALIVPLVARRSLDGFRAGLAGPKWMLLGGLMSAVIVLAITVTGPRIGIVATTALLIVGQFSLATAIDRFGWFGVQQVPLAWPRLLGLALLAPGAALTLKE